MIKKNQKHEIEINKIVNFMDKNNIKNGCDGLFPYWEGIEHGNMTFKQFIKEWKKVGFTYCRSDYV